MANRQFGELVKARSYMDIKSKELPTLQRRVYDALVELSPAKLDFMLSDHPKLSISSRQIDHNTHYLICQVMMELLDNQKLLLTTDDIVCCWQRFKELIFLHQAVKQGIIQERSEPDGTVTYWCELPKKPQLQDNKDMIITVDQRRYNLRVWRR